MSQFYNDIYETICEVLNEKYEKIIIYSFRDDGEYAEEPIRVLEPFQSELDRVYIKIPIEVFLCYNLSRISVNGYGHSVEDELIEIDSSEWERNGDTIELIDFPTKNGIKKISEEHEGIKILIRIPENMCKKPDMEVSPSGDLKVYVC